MLVGMIWPLIAVHATRCELRPASAPTSRSCRNLKQSLSGFAVVSLQIIDIGTRTNRRPNMRIQRNRVPRLGGSIEQTNDDQCVNGADRPGPASVGRDPRTGSITRAAPSVTAGTAREKIRLFQNFRGKISRQQSTIFQRLPPTVLVQDFCSDSAHATSAHQVLISREMQPDGVATHLIQCNWFAFANLAGAPASAGLRLVRHVLRLKAEYQRLSIGTLMVSTRHSNRPVQSRLTQRRGQALVEFAIISFVLSMMVAGLLGIIVLALGSFQNNIAAESAGRVLDGHPVLIKENFAVHFENDPTDPFDVTVNGMNDLTARQVYRFLNEYPYDEDAPNRRIYDETRLVISRDVWDRRDELELSPINESLLGQYIFDPDLTVYDPIMLTDDDENGEFEYTGEGKAGAYRFPGAVVRKDAGTIYPLEGGGQITTGGLTVLVPLIPESETTNGIDRSTYVRPTDEELADIEDHFYPVSEDWVAPVVVGKVRDGDGSEFRLIMFHPSQPASMIQIRLSVDENGRPVRVDENGLPDPNGSYQFPVEANDSAVDIGDPPSDYELVVPENFNPNGRASPYAGRFGLGQSYAFMKTLRPYRAVFEMSSLFRIGARLNPIFAKYEAENSPIDLEDNPLSVHDPTDSAVSPFDDYDAIHNDQALTFNQQVIDRETEALRRFIVDDSLRDAMAPRPADDDNDFVRHVLRLRPNDGGTWRASASAEFATDGTNWDEDHNLQLRLYRNGVYQSLIASHDVTLFQSDSSEPIIMTGNALIEANSGDVLQVRVYTERQMGGYDVQLTGNPEYNWITFERVSD